MAKISDWVYLVQQESFFPASYKTDKRIFGLAAVGRNSKIGGGTYSTVGKYRIDGATLIKDVWGNYQFYTNTNINGQHKYFYDIAESNGGLDVSVSEAKFDNALNRWDAGSPVALDPGDFLALACQVEQNYAWPDLPGDVQNADGSVTHADGSITFPDGTVKQPDGSTSIPWTPLDPSIPPKPPTTDHDITNPDGTITHPDGTITNPDGSYVPALDVVMPNGDIKHSDGSMTLADGRIVGKGDKYNTDGSITRTNGTVSHKDGSITNTDGSTTYPDGVTVPVGYEYYQNGEILPAWGKRIKDDPILGQRYIYLDGSENSVGLSSRMFSDFQRNILGEIISSSGIWTTTINGVDSRYMPESNQYTYSDNYYRDAAGMLYSHSGDAVVEDNIHTKTFRNFSDTYFKYPLGKVYKDGSYVLDNEKNKRIFVFNEKGVGASLEKDVQFMLVYYSNDIGGQIEYYYDLATGDVSYLTTFYKYFHKNGVWTQQDSEGNDMPFNRAQAEADAFKLGLTFPELLAAYGVTFDPTPW
ncbi:TPA: hypothetical protein NPP60_004926 [Klebsiella variicola subsp. variicola]|nr:hypothetical protein [Klebsiella variicola subsp. variicola]